MITGSGGPFGDGLAVFIVSSALFLPEPSQGLSGIDHRLDSLMEQARTRSIDGHIYVYSAAATSADAIVPAAPSVDGLG